MYTYTTKCIREGKWEGKIFLDENTLVCRIARTNSEKECRTACKNMIKALIKA